MINKHYLSKSLDIKQKMEVKEDTKGSISMVEANLPPGFRFHPRDDELVCDYLMKRTVRSLYQPVVLIEVDLNKCEPWDIPRRAPKGRKTDWVMHEFRLQGTFFHHPPNPLKEEWVLCRVFHKNNNEVDRDNNMRSCSNQTVSVSMDSYINFDHHHIINQQVPCFSNLNQTNQSGFVSKNPNPLSKPSSDQIVLRAVLSQLTKSGKESQSYGEGSSESQLTDIGIPNHNAWKY
ncbi:hypothetical protein YC2023_030102 [Brassica napus]